MIHMIKSPSLLLVMVLICLLPGRIWALGMEDFGNKPLGEMNYRDWPGIMPLVNHTTRVYHWWVNGNEQFYYAGDTAAANQAMKLFADVQIKTHEVLLRPGPGVTQSFLINNATEPRRTIPFNWNLHINGGISRRETQLDQGSKIWSESPILSIYIGGDVKLDKLEVPKGVSIIELSDLKQRYREAIAASTDHTVRGWGAGELVQLDPYDTDSLKAVVGLLRDKDDWVRLNAAGAISTFGTKAQTFLPDIRAAMNDSNEQTKTRLTKAIEDIQQAKDTSTEEQSHLAALKAISVFRKSLKE